MDELCEYLGKESSSQREQQVQRPWNRSTAGLVKQQQKGQCGKIESNRKWSQRCSQKQKNVDLCKPWWRFWIFFPKSCRDAIKSFIWKITCTCGRWVGWAGDKPGTSYSALESSVEKWWWQCWSGDVRIGWIWNILLSSLEMMTK